MIKLITTTILSLMCIIAMAQVPQSFEYQAVVRDASGNILASQAVGVQITLKQGGASGIITYQETFSTTTNQFGLVNLQIGTGSTAYNFSTIDWANGPYFIEVALDATGGTSYTVMGTSQLLSVPYALRAKTVEIDNVDDADNDPTNEIELPVGTVANQVLMWNGLNWVAQDACSLFSYYYADKDNDGFGDAFNLVFSCTQPTGYVTDNTDCDDNSAQINPNATEICNYIDDNCDGQIDEGVTLVLQYADADNDGYGDINSPPSYFCTLQPGFSLNNTDCDDSGSPLSGSNYPGATEICDGIDNNCDGVVDEGFDMDIDGFTPCQGDCDDYDNTVYPGAPEICGDGIDNDCDGQTDEGCCPPDGTSCDDGNVNTVNDAYINCSCVGQLINYTLTTSLAGIGSGTITSTPVGINCGIDCTQNYSSGTVVILTATPTTGTFAGWSGGGCSGTGTCTVTMNAAITVTATFNP